MSLDLLDKKILFLLEQNARTPLTTLSKKVRASRELVNYRIERLEKKKYVKYYRTAINQKTFAAGAASFQIKIQKTSLQRTQEIIDYLKNNEFTNWVGEFCGNFDFSATIIYKDTNHLSEIITQIKNFIGKDLLKTSLLIYVDEMKYTRWGILQLKESEKESLRETAFRSEPKSKPKLDEKDIQILKELNKSSKIKNIELSRKTGLGEDAIRNRLKRMEKENVILGYTAFLDGIKFGYNSYFITLEIEELEEKNLELIKKILNSNPYIFYSTRTIGEYNLLISIYSKDQNHFYEQLNQLKYELKNILKKHEFQILIKEHKEIYMPEPLLKPL